MGIGDPLSLFARYWINQTEAPPSHTLSSLKILTTRPWLYYKVCSSYCFGAKQCFQLRACDKFNTESAWNRLFLCSFTDEQGWPASPRLPGQTASSWKQTVLFFCLPPFCLKRAISETSGFCLLLPISCPFCDRVWYNHRIWCWCQARGIRLLYSLAGASGTHVGKTFSFRILLGLARMLQMCHSREVPHFNLLYSFFVDFFFYTRHYFMYFYSVSLAFLWR